jgi:adenosylhomocysteinase
MAWVYCCEIMVDSSAYFDFVGYIIKWKKEQLQVTDVKSEIIKSIYDHISKRYDATEYPALRRQIDDWQECKPLQDMHLLDGTPLFTNTLVKFLPLLAGGAELTVAVSDAIPYDAALLPLLAEWGVPVVKNAISGDYDCILDCGGAHARLTPRLGVVELTRSGYYHYESSKLPVILVDDSRVKTIETCLGTGDGFMRGMEALGYNDWKGRNVVIFGYGKVGRGVAYYCHEKGAIVTAVDRTEVVVPEYVTLIDKNDCGKIQTVVKEAWCVVTATGIREALRGNGAAEVLRNGTQLVAAIGIEDEWGDELPMERRLCNGQPVNFLLDEPTRLRYIDATMALSNAAVLELKNGNVTAGVHRISPSVENYYWQAVEEGGLISNELKGAGL